MATSEPETRIKLVEDRIGHAETVLDGIGRVLKSIERAQATAESAKEGTQTAPVLVAATAIVVVAFVLIARRQHAF